VAAPADEHFVGRSQFKELVLLNEIDALHS
jgi:hypothetical protein